jgi:2',3'-cyclic-nucleotide 2'-phosphodiesterase/3'-nucleotidase
MKNENDHLLNFVKDENGKIKFTKFGHTPILSGRFYDFMSAAGINYVVDVSKPAGHRVTILSMFNGAPFDSAKEYTAAINSYRGNGGGGHLIRGAKIPKSQLASRVINSTVKDLRFYIMKWIEKEGKVTPKAFGNWEVIPSKWAEKGRAKDYKLLYGNKQ